MLLSTNDGVLVDEPIDPEADGYYMVLLDAVSGLDEYDVNRIVGQEAKKYIFAHPVEFLVRARSKR